MRHLILFLAFAISLLGQTTVYLRYGGPGTGVKISGASNSTPIRIATTTDHGFVTGDHVWVFGVRGNTSANGYRKVVAVDSTTFDITGFDDAPVAAVGPYDGSGYVGKVRATTLVAHPRGLLDGPGGTITTRAQDPDGTGPLKAPHALTGFTPWEAISTWNPTGVASPLSAAGLASVDTSEPMLPTALAWFGNQSDTSKRNAMLAWLNNIHLAYDARSIETPYFATCDESKLGCGVNGPDLDWRSFMSVGAYDSYSLLRSEMTTQERQAYADKVLGGLYGESCNNRLVMGGESRVTAAGTSVTCSSGNCNFTSIPSPANRFFYFRTTSGTYGQWRKIASVIDDNRLDLTTPIASPVTTETDIPWGYVNDWSLGSCGDIWWQIHHPSSAGFLTLESFTKLGASIDATQTTITVENAGNIPVTGRPYYLRIGGSTTHEWVKVISRSGNNVTVERGQLYTAPRAATAGTTAGNVWGTSVPLLGGEGTSIPSAVVNPWDLDLDSPTHNLYWSRTFGALRAGDALADDDERARKLLQDAWNYFYDFVYRDAKDRWNGMTQGGYSYGPTRWHQWVSEAAYIGKYHFSPAIDITDGVWLKSAGDYMPHFNLPWGGAGGRSIMWGDSGSDDYLPARHFRYLMLQYYLFGAGKEASEGLFWYRNIFGRWNLATFKSSADYQVAAHAYLFVPPSVTCPSAECPDYRTTSNLTRFFLGDSFDNTPFPTSYNFVSSRSDWTTAPLSWVTMNAHGDPNDHTATPGPSTYDIAVNGQWIHASGPQTRDENNYGQVRPESTALSSANVSGTTNAGNGTITWPSDAMGSKVVTGNYLLTCIAASPGGGTFSVTSPFGEKVGNATVGVEYTIPPYFGPIKFTITAGSADWAVGDKKYLVVYGGYLRFSQSSYPDINKILTGVTYTHGLAMPKQNKNSKGYFGDFVTVDKTKADGGYAYWRVNLDNSYQTSAAVSRARRHFAHLTGTESYTIVYDELVTTNAKPKERSTFCYTDDGPLTATKSGNTLNCTRSNSRMQSIVLLPSDPNKITQTGEQLLEDTSYVYYAGSASQQPNGSRRTWTLPRSAAWPKHVRIDADGSGSGGYVRQTWGIAGTDTGKQWYWSPDTPIVTQCDNTTDNTCPGDQEPAPPAGAYVDFSFYLDKSVGWTINDGSTLGSEILLVHCAFAATTGDCPATSTLATISSNSRGVLILHSDRPKVAIFDNDSRTANTSASFTLSALTSAAEMLVSGLAAGTYDVKKDSASIYTGLTVGNDGVLPVPASGGHGNGDYLILQTGASAPLDITTASPLSSGTVGLPYSTNLSAIGGTPPYIWERTGGDAWPTGITLSSSGTVSGTPTTAETKSVQVRVCDSTLVQQCTAAITLTLQIAASQSQTLTFTGPVSIPSGTINTAYPAQTLLATGGTPPYVFSLQSGTMPPGLSLSGTGSETLSGTPAAAGTFNFILRVSDTSNPVKTQDRSYSVTISAAEPPLTISTSTVPDGVVGETYDATFAATDGTQPYEWSVISGSLCPGLTLTIDGQLSGAPTIASECQFTVEVQDAAGQTANRIYTMVTVQPISANLSATVRPSSQSAVIVYGRAGLDAAKLCQLSLWQGSTLVEMAIQNGGRARRFEIFSSLLPETDYTTKADCTGEVSDVVPFTTLPAITGSRAETLQLAAPPWASIVTVNWGINSVSENEVAQSCPGSCSIQLPNLQRGVIYRVQHSWTSAGGATTVVSSPYYLPVD